MSLSILSVRIHFEHDVVTARQRARQIAALLGFDSQQQTRLATTVSEIARNAFTYGGGGKAEFCIEGKTSPQVFFIRISDEGPGIQNLQQILDGEYASATGMGLGILGARRLMDRFVIESAPGRGTTVALSKILPRKAPLITLKNLATLVDALNKERPHDLLQEFREQNQELLRTLEELRNRQDELVRLNRELEDTNRGVVALYAELDERADHLRRADEVKTRFLSNMSHEFRTPLNSILALSRLLLERTDGDLTSEQEKQLYYIRKSAESLFDLVNDVLDIAKVEAGKITIRPAEFEAHELFGALRGMLRPLLLNTAVNLVFEDPAVPPLYTDEGKVSQILRNFISNALKFTERGEVRVAAEFDSSADIVTFSVADTGIGIPPDAQEIIFQEFTQLDSALQRRVKGTGLGLPLSRKLAELLGGRVFVKSEPGIGSTFSAAIPLNYAPPEPALEPAAWAAELDATRMQILVVEDHYETRLIYEKYLKGSPFQVVSARTVREAEDALLHIRPAAIILDVLLQGEDSWDLLAHVKNNPGTRGVPVIMVTTVQDQQKAIGLGADHYAIKPVEREWLQDILYQVTGQDRPRKVLIVDDQEVSRYLLRQLFSGWPVSVLEAGGGSEGLRLARAESPALVILDLVMPDMSGLEVLSKLKSDPLTRSLPVMIATSKVLTDEERQHLSEFTVGILRKQNLSDDDAVDKLQDILLQGGLIDLIPVSSAQPAHGRIE